MPRVNSVSGADEFAVSASCYQKLASEHVPLGLQESFSLGGALRRTFFMVGS